MARRSLRARYFRRGMDWGDWPAGVDRRQSGCPHPLFARRRSREQSVRARISIQQVSRQIIFIAVPFSAIRWCKGVRNFPGSAISSGQNSRVTSALTEIGTESARWQGRLSGGPTMSGQTFQLDAWRPPSARIQSLGAAPSACTSFCHSAYISTWNAVCVAATCASTKARNSLPNCASDSFHAARNPG
jgi:hypothetical protein